MSFVGPTGSGKSFLLSSLMAPDERKANGPTVSTPGQHVPESGNVFVFDSNPIGEHRDWAGPFELRWVVLWCFSCTFEVLFFFIEYHLTIFAR